MKQKQIDSNVAKYVIATRNMDPNFIHTVLEEICSFCEKGKVVSGIYLHFKSTGHPCCNECYNKAKGFNEWFAICQKRYPEIPKQLDWFVEMFCKGYTPDEAIDAMLLVV